MQHDATCILMKRLVREQHIKTIRSEEQDKDSLAREKLELLLSGMQILFDPSSRLRCDRIDLLICNSATWSDFAFSWQQKQLSDCLSDCLKHVAKVIQTRFNLYNQIKTFRRQQRIQMLENAENQKEALEKEKQEMLLGEQDLHLSSRNLGVVDDDDDEHEDELQPYKTSEDFLRVTSCLGSSHL